MDNQPAARLARMEIARRVKHLRWVQANVEGWGAKLTDDDQRLLLIMDIENEGELENKLRELDG